MYHEDMLKEITIWRHVASGGLYLIMGVARCSTNGEREGKERSVVYYSVERQHFNYREMWEFLDGRFEPVPPTK
jgi:hypothetical protein